MAPRGANLEPQGHPKYTKDTKMYPKVPKCRRRCYNEAPGHPQCQKDTARPSKVVLGIRLDPRVAKNTYKPPAAGCSPQAT